MTLFQLILLIGAGTIFYLFFRQLFGGHYPKRGVDFEAKTPEAQIGGLMEPNKTFSRPSQPISRVDELLKMAGKAAAKSDWLEVKKAMQSAQILDGNNVDVLRRLGVAFLEMHDYAEAQKTFEAILAIDPKDDLAENALANTLHKLGEDDAAVLHHKRAIQLDDGYAPYHFNYANTLYELGRKTEALEQYKKALICDPDLKEAKKMIKELEHDD